MTTANTNTDLRNGVNGDVGCKYPCVAATMTNIDLMLNGLSPINGITPVEGQPWLVNSQTDPTENGVYVASTGEWERGVWFNSQLNVAPGTLVVTYAGTQYPNTIWETICADNPIQFGASLITFNPIVSGINTGDITLVGQNYLSLSNQVLTAKTIALTNMANLAANSFIGNNTVSPTIPIALTQAQATALLNVFIGDSGSGGLQGLVPAPAAGDAAALKFLKADGTWSITPDSTQATETQLGVAEIATQAKTNAGTDDLTIVTPLKLATKPGLTVQVVNFSTGTYTTGTTVIPLDNTIPQNTDGDQYMSATITPNNASNKLLIEILFNFNHSNAITVTTALYQDSIASALCAIASTVASGAQAQQNKLIYYMTAGTTSATTFKVRAGGSSAGTLYFNGISTGGIFGGVYISSITITEIAA